MHAWGLPNRNNSAPVLRPARVKPEYLNYLLPAQPLLDLCAVGCKPTLEWADSVDTRRLPISVISIADAQATIMQVQDVQERSRLEVVPCKILCALSPCR